MDFEAWNGALCCHFFLPENADSPIFFFADDDALAEMHESGDEHAACTDLAEAVRAELSLHARNQFVGILRQHRAWRQGDRQQCPPSLPLLALAVNAAAHMHADDSFRANNYYVRFRELLGIGGKGEPDGYGTTLPLLWRDLSDWLDSVTDGAFGTSTIRRHPHWPYIGYAQSQALFRESDTDRLDRLFDDLDLPTIDEWDESEPPISPSELRIHFRLWAPSTSGLSPGARRMATDSSYDELLEHLLWDAAKKWRGVRTSSGTLLAKLVPGISARFPLKMQFWPQRLDGMPQSVKLEDGYVLESETVEWYDLTPVPLGDWDLSDGLHFTATASGGQFEFEYDASTALPFREDPVIGEWLAVSRVRPQESHWLLISDHLAPEVEMYLDQYAEPFWKKARSVLDLPGWSFYRDVEINRTAPLEDFPSLWRLRPANQLRPTLHGGLKLRDLGAAVYLTGGAPDVWVPPGAIADDDSDFAVGDRSLQSPGIEGGEVELRPLGLPAGHHTVRAGQRSISFNLIESRERTQHDQAGSVASRIDIESHAVLRTASIGAEPPVDVITVSGGFISGPGTQERERPVSLLAKAEESFLLGARPSEVDRPKEPHIPPWLERTRLDPQRFDAAAAFEVAWTMQRFLTDYWVVRCVCPGLEPVAEGEMGGRDARDWAGLFIVNADAVRSAGALGSRYIELAEIIEGERK